MTTIISDLTLEALNSLSIVSVVRQHGVDTGGSVVMGGQAVQQHLAWLFDAAQQDSLLDHAATVTTQFVKLSPDADNAINVHYLAGRGDHIPKRHGKTPITAILFGNTLLPGEGGELVLGDFQELTIRPTAGQIVFFNSDISYQILPLNTPDHLIAVVIAYVFDD